MPQCKCMTCAPGQGVLRRQTAPNFGGPRRLLFDPSDSLAVFLPILCYLDMTLLLIETFQGRLLETSL